MQILESFCVDSLIFYPLHLQTEEIPNNLYLDDFLEEKICILLNLSKEHEYFLRFYRSNQIYYCFLLSKEQLKPFVTSQDSYLSHPCFLGLQCVESSAVLQYILIYDNFKQWVLVGYEKGQIIDFYTFKDFENLHKKLESFGANFQCFLWQIETIPSLDSALLKPFVCGTIHKSLEQLEKIEIYNFNPLEKTTPFWQQHSGMLTKYFLYGALCGILCLGIMACFNYLNTKKLQHLKQQLHTLKDMQIMRENNLSKEQSKVLVLEKNLQELQALHTHNSSLLHKSLKNSLDGFDYFTTLSANLTDNTVKIAYFGAKNNILELLIIGKDSLKFIETLEQKMALEVEHLEHYDGFFWIGFTQRKIH